MNNPKSNDYIDVIYPKELEIKDTTDAPKWANYLDHHLEFDDPMTSVMTDFPIVNFPSSNIPESPAYDVFVSQFRIMLGFVRKIKIYSGFKVIEAWILFTETSDYLHMLNGLFTSCDI